MKEIFKFLLRLVPFLQSYPQWVQAAFFFWLFLTLGLLALLFFVPRQSAGKTPDGGQGTAATTPAKGGENNLNEGVAKVLRDYQNDTVYRDWRRHYCDELFAGLDSLPPDQARGILATRIDTLVVDFNADISNIERRLAAPPDPADGNGIPRLIEAYAKKNKVRIRASLLDARQIIRDQPKSGVTSRDLLIQAKGILQ